MERYGTARRAWEIRQAEDEEAAKKFKARLGRSHLDEKKPLTPYQLGQFAAERKDEEGRRLKEELEGRKMAEWNLRRGGASR